MTPNRHLELHLDSLSLWRRDWNILCCQREEANCVLLVFFSLTTGHMSTAGCIPLFCFTRFPSSPCVLLTQTSALFFFFFIFRNPTTPDDIKKKKKKTLQKTNADESTSRLWLSSELLWVEPVTVSCTHRNTALIKHNH